MSASWGYCEEKMTSHTEDTEHSGLTFKQILTYHLYSVYLGKQLSLAVFACHLVSFKAQAYY